MVALVRRGKSQRYVAGRFGVTLRTVQRWVERGSDWPLRSVDWKSRSHAPRGIANRTPVGLEREICTLRRQLAASSALGFIGAQAIHEALLGQSPFTVLPRVRTFALILRPIGFLAYPHPIPRPPPPPAW